MFGAVFVVALAFGAEPKFQLGVVFFGLATDGAFVLGVGLCGLDFLDELRAAHDAVRLEVAKVAHASVKDGNVDKCRTNAKTREDVANNEGVQHDNEVQNAEPLHLHGNDKHEIHLHFRIYNGKGKEDGNVDVIGAKYVRQLAVEDLQNIELVFVEPLGHKRSVRFSEQGKGHVREEIADAKAKDGRQRR